MNEERTVFARVGGLPAFVALVDAFYDRVEHDPLLRPMYPDDLGPGKEGLALFFAQYWGGGDLYSADRGHPRLRMRHAPFPVGSEQITAWLTDMRGALDEIAPAQAEADELWAYFERAAHFLRNSEG